MTPHKNYSIEEEKPPPPPTCTCTPMYLNPGSGAWTWICNCMPPYLPLHLRADKFILKLTASLDEYNIQLQVS